MSGSWCQGVTKSPLSNSYPPGTPSRLGQIRVCINLFRFGKIVYKFLHINVLSFLCSGVSPLREQSQPEHYNIS